MAEQVKQYIITPLSEATPADGDAAIKELDARFDQTESHLNDLSARIGALNTKSAIIRQNVPFAPDVVPGMLVYYDVGSKYFAAAVAATLPESTAGGNTIEAPSARVEGLVLSITSRGTQSLIGTMLCGGYWEDQDLMDYCLGDDATAGTYYLTPDSTVAGTATMDTYGHLRQPVLSYYNDGKFSLNIFYMAHDNHFHASQVLEDAWTPVADIHITGVTPPTGAQYVYVGAYDIGLGTIGNTTAVFWKGVLQRTLPPTDLTEPDTRKFIISDGLLWYMDSGQPQPKEVVLFNHYPFAYDSSVIRSIYSDSSSLTVNNTNGIVKLTANDFVDGEVIKSSYAVATIKGNELQFTPVITDLLAGPGMSVSKALDGSAYISSANMVDGLLDATGYNYNGTTQISNGLLQFITFPAGRISQLIMYRPIQGITAKCQLVIWGMKVGTNSPALDIQACFIPDPTADTQSTTAVQQYIGSLEFAAGADASSIAYGEVTIGGCTVSGAGTMIATVTVPSQPTQQIQLLRAGFKLNVINETSQTVMYDGNAITQTLPVGDDDIQAGQAVMIVNYPNDGPKLIPCTNEAGSQVNNSNRCVGVAVEDASASSDNLTYMITGTMTLSNVSAAPGQSLYIGTDGMLVPVTDTDDFLTEAKFLQKVGTALTGNKIQINIESAVEGGRV